MTESKPFEAVATLPGSPRWDKLTMRPSQLYSRNDDIRSPFARDYTRILHSMAYRRLKHKTQVFYNIDNDHICTRMEHVAHVESVSGTIAKALGLNTELTKAISIGHDIGHAPFGHKGEEIISGICQKHLGESFWHERNGLRIADKVELLRDNYNISRNLDLTYAVRDGIIAHCGEIDENALKPRDELIDLKDFSAPGKYQPATWEGCVVKISDKIAYVGRDIEDAITLGFLNSEAIDELTHMARANDSEALNTTVIMHNLIIDICENSTPDRGITLSDRFLTQLNSVKSFNYKYIYGNKRFEAFIKYARLVIDQIFDCLMDTYGGERSWENIAALKKFCPTLAGAFENSLAKYCDEGFVPKGELADIARSCQNEKIYGTLSSEKIYAQAIIDYIAGMTDRFAVKCFDELISY